MTDPAARPVDCAAVSDDLLEFGLGTLSGRSRSLVLEHVEECSECSAELESLASVTDALTRFAPEAEPPLGFETRLAERVRGIGVRRGNARRRRVAVLAAAAAIVAVISFAVGALATNSGAGRPVAAVRPTTAQLTSGGRVLGQVSVVAGNPTWLIMTIDSGSWSGPVWCEVTLSNGRMVDVGSFSLSRGQGSWTSRVKVSADQLRSAELVEVSGHVLAKASLLS